MHFDNNAISKTSIELVSINTVASIFGLNISHLEKCGVSVQNHCEISICIGKKPCLGIEAGKQRPRHS